MYNLIESAIEVEGKALTSYGISYEGGQIKDISTEKEEVEKLVNKLNDLSVDEIHILDIVYDFIG